MSPTSLPTISHRSRGRRHPETGQPEERVERRLRLSRGKRGPVPVPCLSARVTMGAHRVTPGFKQDIPVDILGKQHTTGGELRTHLSCAEDSGYNAPIPFNEGYPNPKSEHTLSLEWRSEYPLPCRVFRHPNTENGTVEGSDVQRIYQRRTGVFFARNVNSHEN